MVRYARLTPRMWRSPVSDAVIALVAPRAGETVLDIGAGMGPAVVAAADAGASVIAVDPTPFMRSVMSVRRLLSRHRKQIRVVDGAAEALPAGGGTVDAICTVNTLHHWTDPARGAAEMARVLAPGGRVVLVDENFADPRHPYSEEWLARHGSGHDHEHHGFSMVDAEDFAALLGNAGLSDVTAEHCDLAGRPVIMVRAAKATSDS